MKKISAKKSRFGNGIFAEREFEKGETICFLDGKQMGPEVYQFSESVIHPLQIEKEEYILLKKPFIFINHSCNPNAGVKGKNKLFALKKIRKGTEICFDYSTTMDEGFDCQCGSKNCRKKTIDFFALPLSLQKKYLKMGAVPDFIKKKAIKKIKEGGKIPQAKKTRKKRF